jgi:lysylphosphatidylglycerol synthetase-like protein (DUF2156 family)
VTVPADHVAGSVGGNTDHGAPVGPHVTSTAIVERLRFAMRVLGIGGLAMVLSILSPLFLGVSVTPIAIALCGVLGLHAVLAFVGAAAFRRAKDNERAARRGLVLLGIWLVLAAAVTVAFTFQLHMPDLEQLQ